MSALIGLCGYGGVGKDSVADILVKEHGFKRYAFADKLKEMAYAINPYVPVGWDWMPLQHVIDTHGWDKGKREIPEVRELLQRVGVWHRDKIAQDFWVDVIRNQWLQDGRPPAVVTDVRFPNEARFVRSYDGHVVRVVRPGVGPVNGHESERQEFAAGWTLYNSETLSVLAEEVRVMLWPGALT